MYVSWERRPTRGLRVPSSACRCGVRTYTLVGRIRDGQRMLGSLPSIRECCIAKGLTEDWWGRVQTILAGLEGAEQLRLLVAQRVPSCHFQSGVEVLLRLEAAKSFQEAQVIFRKAAKSFHPDRGGDPGWMKEISVAFTEVKSRFGA